MFVLQDKSRHIEHMHEGGWFRKTIFVKMTAVRIFISNRAFVYALMVPSWADQLLPQIFMEQLDTLLIQCRNIEHMHEEVWFRKNNF